MCKLELGYFNKRNQDNNRKDFIISAFDFKFIFFIIILFSEQIIIIKIFPILVDAEIPIHSYAKDNHFHIAISKLNLSTILTHSYYLFNSILNNSYCILENNMDDLYRRIK